MKAIRGSLAAICLLVLVVVTVSALVEQKPERKPVATNRLKVVYVDMNRLMTVHPSWNQVLNLRRAANELSGGGRSISVSSDADLRMPGMSGTAYNTAARSQYSKDIEQNALQALTGIESFERRKIKRDLDAKRAELDADMRARINEKTRLINEEIASSVRSVEMDRRTGKVEAQLKVAALRSRIGSVNPEEDKDTREEVTKAEAALVVYDKTTKESVDKICQTHKDELDRFKTQCRLSMQAELDRIAGERESQMLDSIKTQRDQTIADLRGDALRALVIEDSSSRGANANAGGAVISNRMKTRAVYKDSVSDESLKRIRDAESRLIAKIKRDVIRLIEKTARTHQWEVQYTRNAKTPDIPDYTLRVMNTISRVRSIPGVESRTGGSG